VRQHETKMGFVRLPIARIVQSLPAGRSLGPTAEKAVPFLSVLWTDPRFRYSITALLLRNSLNPSARQLPDAHSATWLQKRNSQFLLRRIQ